ncbi:MAG: phosphatase PAP2 family protein [Flavobacteriales bacterium]|nr:phosphatase PAP2 family protein [Flavobacteriales bacterium]
MWDTLNDIDIKIFLFLNNMGIPQLDRFFMAVTDWAFIPFAVMVAYFLFTRIDKKLLPLALILLGIAILISDQLCGNVIREMNIRLRPCHMEELQGLFRPVRAELTGFCGGQYGFVSSHAGNAFAMAVFSSMALKGRVKHIWCYTLFFAIVIAYSRIYIGTHLTGDVVVGGAIGATAGVICALIYRWEAPHIIRILEKKA